MNDFQAVPPVVDKICAYIDGVFYAQHTIPEDAQGIAAIIADHDAEKDSELTRLREIVNRLPHKDDIELAIRANNMGGPEFKPDYCRCDPDVGCSPCPYCAIDSLLQRLLEAAEAAKGTEP